MRSLIIFIPLLMLGCASACKHDPSNTSSVSIVGLGLAAALAVVVSLIVDRRSSKGLKTLDGDLAEEMNLLNATLHRVNKVEDSVLVCENTEKVFGAQLRGAGQRIRSIEAKMAAMEKTVDRVLSGDDDDVGASAARRLALLDVARAVQKLRSDIFGGPADAGGMPKRGALTDLREQVEGINTNLGKRVKAVEGSQSAGARSAAQTAAVTETRRLLRELGIYPRPSLWQRLRRLFRKDT